MLLTALSLTIAVASATAPDSTPTTQPAKPAKPKKVCQKIEMTGSTVPKRVCRTVVEPAPTKGEVANSDSNKPQGSATN